MDGVILTVPTYTPEPLPQDQGLVSSLQAGNTQKNGIIQTPVLASSFPEKIVAQDTISTAINTMTQQILQQFSLTQTGGIKVGNYQNGLSGEVDITPNGILGKNVNGTQTFGLDAATGDAIFYGIIKAAGFNIVDTNGIISDLDTNFRADDTSVNSTQTTNSTTFVDIPGASVTFTLPRQARVLVFLFGYGKNDDFNNGDNLVEMQVYDTLTSGSIGVNVWMAGNWFTKVDWDAGTGLINSTSEISTGETQSNINIVTLAAGTHTLKLRFRVDPGGNATMYNCRVGYVVLGN